MAKTHGIINGLPTAHVLGAEIWFTSAQLHVEDLAVGALGTEYSYEVELYGCRNVTVYFDPGAIGGTLTISLQTLSPADESTVLRDAQIAAGLAGAGWLAYDLGIGTAILPGAVFGLCRLKIVETGGAAAQVSAFMGARH